MSNLVNFDADILQFNLDSGITGAQYLEQLQNLIDSGRPAGLLFRGPEILEHANNLRDVECRGLIGPRRRMDGLMEAVTATGLPLTITYTLADNVERTANGIITDLAITISNGKYGQEASMTFWPVNCLAYRNSGVRLGNCGGGGIEVL